MILDTFINFENQFFLLTLLTFQDVHLMSKKKTWPHCVSSPRQPNKSEHYWWVLHAHHDCIKSLTVSCIWYWSCVTAVQPKKIRVLLTTDTNKIQLCTLCSRLWSLKSKTHGQLSIIKHCVFLYLLQKKALRHFSASLGQPIHPLPPQGGQLLVKAHEPGSERRKERFIYKNIFLNVIVDDWGTLYSNTSLSWVAYSTF